jgi:hypothetical protein
MDNLYRGEPVSKEQFIHKLVELNSTIERDLQLEPLMPQIVIEAAHTLSKEIDQQEVICQLDAMGIPKWAAEEYVKVTIDSLDRKQLQNKIDMELGENPFIWKRVGEQIEEREQPLGVILHIGAGNALGLSAFSVLEGLLTGNINILKLPEQEGGISTKLLLRLIQIEPRLMPYIYVLDVSSKEKEIINQLIEIVNAVVVWGSDDAIRTIRQLTPPNLPVIEWGHRLSFAYFTNNKNMEKDLELLAKEVCLTDQLYCSSPQCIFFETDNIPALEEFADKFACYLETATASYPVKERPIDVQAQITLMHELVHMEEILKEKRLITDSNKRFSVMVDYNTALKASPLFRNIWVMKIQRDKLFKLLRTHKGYLQTVGLSCRDDEYEELSQILYSAGINRITACGAMSANYSGEPHDGVYALQRYIRKVNRLFRKGKSNESISEK